MSEALVVASKVKKYIKDKAGFNTSASAIDALTIAVRHLIDQAVTQAQQEGRKTVMDRDVTKEAL